MIFTIIPSLFPAELAIFPRSRAGHDVPHMAIKLGISYREWTQMTANDRE
jgi:hypothetical protein